MFIVKAQAEYLYTDQGEKLIDLFSAHGAVSLGHEHPDIKKALNYQQEKIWLTGGLPTLESKKAQEILNSFFPKTHQTALFYSTGMEAAEFALRVARVHTEKRGIISFEGDMHGKSALAASLGWDNSWQDKPVDIYRLPSLRQAPEQNILNKIRKLLSDKSIAGIIIEPCQCSNGGFSFLKNFYDELVPLCRKAGVLIILDEILTGFYRTGELFCFSALGFIPDIVLLGKALGNGFPVSAVVMRKDIEVKKEMLPKSTFSDNPLAAAVVMAVLKQYKKSGWSKKANLIAKIIQEQVEPLKEYGVVLRGAGACWILELPEQFKEIELTAHFIKKGLAINQVNNYIRLMPPLIIEPRNLEKATQLLCAELKKIL